MTIDATPTQKGEREEALELAEAVDRAWMRSVQITPPRPTPSPKDLEGLAERLRSTTEEMANCCSVDQTLWNVHSNACLEAVAALLSSSKAEGEMREALEKAVAALEEAEAILGGEYGDHYAVLCERMFGLRAALTPKEGA